VTGAWGVSKQTLASSARDLMCDPVDILIVAGTWDVRCLSMVEVQWERPVPRVLLVKYANSGKSGRARSYTELLLEHFSAESSARVSDISIDSSNLVAAWSDMKAAVLDAYVEVGRPIRIGLDITSVPRYVWLNLLGYAAETGVIAGFEFVYTAAHEYEYVDGPRIFSDGVWKPRAIATLGRGAQPSAESLLVVSGGFEGANTLRLVNALEPDRVLVALSSSQSIEHDRDARRANAPLAQEYGLAGEVIEFPLSDVSTSVANLDRALGALERGPSRELAISFLLCGSKISALVIGLYAIRRDIAQIYFSDPQFRLETTASSIEWITCVSVNL